MKKPVNILMIEDSRDDADLLGFELDRGKIDHKITRVWEIKKLESELQKPDWDLVLCDYYLPGFTGADAINIIAKKRPELPIILVSGMVGEEKAVEVLKLGAKDYILKDNLSRLISSVKREVHEFKLRKANLNIEKALETQTSLSQIFLDHIPAKAMLVDIKSYQVIAANANAIETGTIPGKKCYEYNPELEKPCKKCKLQELNKKKKHLNIEYKRDGEVHDEHWVYINDMLALHYSFDITERKKSESRLKLETSINKVFSELSHEIIAPGLSIQKIADLVHNTALGLTGARYGYVSSIDPDSSENILHTLSSMLNQCDVSNKRISFPKGKSSYNGLWGHTLNTKKAFYSNTPSKHKSSRGLPQGHVPIKSFLTAPAMVKGEVIGQIALANTDNGFNDYDLQSIEKLANLYALALFRKQAENELMESEEKYRDLIDNALVGVFKSNIKGDVIFGNDAFKNIMGFDVSHKFSNGIVKTLYNDKEDRKTLIKELKKHKKVSNYEIDLITQKGKLVHALLNATINQNIISGTILDITEEKKSELREKKSKAELIVAKDKAEESDRLKSAFLSNMSHEIRTPMNAILGFTQILKDNKISEKERDSYIDIIEQSGKGMLELLSDILDFSRIESGNLIIRNEEFYVDNYIDELFEKFQKELELENNHHLKLRLSKPETDQTIILKKDKLRLTQVLSSLFNNSLKFTKQGFIEIGYSLNGKNIKFHVKDSGIGIRKDKLEIIFQRFRQADDENTRKYGGAGLGLAISKSIVEIMGGKIWVESLEGTSSSFYFTIPVFKISKVTKHKDSEFAQTGKEQQDHSELLEKTIL
ncbi:MAG: ATP-binding protein, partial [Bacteroidota bacterium]|nr:ATP-binding protein [Bacteroidota bacterium]